MVCNFDCRSLCERRIETSNSASSSVPIADSSVSEDSKKSCLAFSSFTDLNLRFIKIHQRTVKPKTINQAKPRPITPPTEKVMAGRGVRVLLFVDNVLVAVVAKVEGVAGTLVAVVVVFIDETPFFFFSSQKLISQPPQSGFDFMLLIFQKSCTTTPWDAAWKTFPTSKEARAWISPAFDFEISSSLVAPFRYTFRYTFPS